MVSSDGDLGLNAVDDNLGAASRRVLDALTRSLAEEVARPLRSAEAFADLYDRTHLIVFRYIYGIHGGPAEEVEDLAADTYIRAWRARRRFEGDQDDALRWLFQIARRLVIDAHRRRGRRGIPDNIDDLMLSDSGVSPEQRAQAAEQRRVLLRTLDNLPDRQREILVLRYMLGWPVKLIARHLDMLPNTVSVNIRRALKRLRQDWPQQYWP
jgi:RNA polymerase sigma-70 factor (ECF subfamily)